ncbi:MAG: hypothetical protein U0457_20170 [Candidatus Sericytochromatia bacterium]
MNKKEIIYIYLREGDLRSIGKVKLLIEEIRNQTDFDELFCYLYSDERLIKMRAIDAIEKITISNSHYLVKHKKEILDFFKLNNNIEFKWHLALIIPRLDLLDIEIISIWNILKSWASNKKESKIVRVNSIQALSMLLLKNNSLEEDYNSIINEILLENIPSIKARIKKIKNGAKNEIK